MCSWSEHVGQHLRQQDNSPLYPLGLPSPTPKKVTRQTSNPVSLDTDWTLWAFGEQSKVLSHPNRRTNRLHISSVTMVLSSGDLNLLGEQIAKEQSIATRKGYTTRLFNAHDQLQLGGPTG